MEMDKTSKLKQEIEEYLTKDYCCEFKKECKDGVRIRCSEYEAKLYLILRFAEPREKRIAELEKEISVLLSCKNCPENKGGYICEKEYENKCLAQKIEYIKELQKENAELSEKLNRHKHDCPNCSAFGKHCPHRVNGDPYTYDCYLTVADLEKENAELKRIVKMVAMINKNIYTEEGIKAIYAEAEKFISEVKK